MNNTQSDALELRSLAWQEPAWAQKERLHSFWSFTWSTLPPNTVIISSCIASCIVAFAFLAQKIYYADFWGLLIKELVICGLCLGVAPLFIITLAYWFARLMPIKVILDDHGVIYGGKRLTWDINAVRVIEAGVKSRLICEKPEQLSFVGIAPYVDRSKLEDWLINSSR